MCVHVAASYTHVNVSLHIHVPTRKASHSRDLSMARNVQDAVSERCATVIKHAEKRRAYKSSVRLIEQPANPEEDWPSLKATAPPASVHAPIRNLSPPAKRRKR